MTWLGLIAFVSGVLGVWLTIRQLVACWPMALISVVCSAIEFYRERLYGDMSLQVFYFFAGIYGWIYWQRNKGKVFIVTRMPPRFFAAAISVTASLTIICYIVLTHYGGDRTFLDGLLTAGSLVGTYMMTRKWLENWAAWVVIDAAYVLLYLLKEMWIFAALYLFFTVMAAYGWTRWRKAVS